MIPIAGRGVTANMPVLGTGDSGFESRRPDKNAWIFFTFTQNEKAFWN
jgi:hypothetical protein